MTYGELITRLCQLRDEMRKTPESQELLECVIYNLRNNPQMFGGNDESISGV